MRKFSLHIPTVLMCFMLQQIVLICFLKVYKYVGMLYEQLHFNGKLVSVMLTSIIDIDQISIQTSQDGERTAFGDLLHFHRDRIIKALKIAENCLLIKLQRTSQTNENLLSFRLAIKRK